MTYRMPSLMALLLLAACSTVPKPSDETQPGTAQQFSYLPFAEVLGAHVADGIVDYPAIAADPRFDAFLEQFDRIDPQTLKSSRERLAFWINAYNAFAIEGILDGYSPVTLFGRYRYFIGRDYRVGDEKINLYNLEQQLLIPVFHEVRIHFAIVRASRSSPKLQSSVYTADRLEQQLDHSAREFINDSSRNRFDRGRKVAYLSKIFEWFEKDFAAEAGSLLRYVQRYIADRELARELETYPYKVEFLEYDWRLNGLPPLRLSNADTPR
jgi:hypothetical protein